MFHPECHCIAQLFTDCILNILLQVYEPFQLKAKSSHLWITITRAVQIIVFMLCLESWSCLLGHNWGLPLRKLKMQSNWQSCTNCHLCYRPLQIWFPVFGTQFSVTHDEVESRRRWMKPGTNGLISLWVLHGADIAWLWELDHAICLLESQ